MINRINFVPYKFPNWLCSKKRLKIDRNLRQEVGDGAFLYKNTIGVYEEIGFFALGFKKDGGPVICWTNPCILVEEGKSFTALPDGSYAEDFEVQMDCNGNYIVAFPIGFINHSLAAFLESMFGMHKANDTLNALSIKPPYKVTKYNNNYLISYEGYSLGSINTFIEGVEFLKTLTGI